MTVKNNRKAAQPVKAATPAKPAPAAVVTNAGAMNAMTSVLTGQTKPEPKPASAAKQSKEDIAAERARRYPAAAAAEAAKKAGQKAGTTTRKAGAKPDGAKVEKVAKVTVEIVKRTLPKNSAFHAISLAARPTSGARLAAHTHAALMILGMLDASCPTASLAAVRTIMGDRAIAYHTKEVNFETVQDHGIRLTPAGRNKFLTRTVDGKMANAFADLFLDGKVDEATLQVKKGEVYQAKA